MQDEALEVKGVGVKCGTCCNGFSVNAVEVYCAVKGYCVCKDLVACKRYELRGEQVATIEGMGKDEPLEVNERGGKQSKLDHDFTLVDGQAMFVLARVLKYGADKYERDNWRKISVDEHLNHCLSHLFAYLANDNQDDHLDHALCRLHMAVAIREQGGPK